MVHQMKKRDRRSVRMVNYDYSAPGAYFITICTFRRANLLGEIKDGSARLSAAGKLVEQCWLEIPQRYENILLDEFVIMPNHFHGILLLETGGDSPPDTSVDGSSRVQTHPFRYPPAHRRRMLIPRIVGYFKMNSAKRINRMRGTSGERVWQRNYYERVVRSEDELRRIREYIVGNPASWELDKENPKSANFGVDHALYFGDIYDKQLRL
jgi:REP element-mobilizing transposase RayT